MSEQPEIATALDGHIIEHIRSNVSFENQPPLKFSQQEKNADLALTFLHREHVAAAPEATAAEQKALLRKIDWMILPLMSAVYFLQFLDKTLINYANVMGLSTDTNTSPAQFSYLATAFYVAYLVCEPPTGYLMQKLPVAKYLGANVILWGVAVSMNCVCKDFTSLLVLRILLGIFEASVTPCLLLITGMWYKRREQPARIGLWYISLAVGSILGALMSYGLQFYRGTAFKSWQIMFLILGLLTIVTGILVFLYLPNNPMTSRLSHDEKILAIERIRENMTGIENKTFKPAQMWETLGDWQTWGLSLIAISASIPNGAASSFQATIIKSFGYTSQQSALLSIPSGGVVICAIAGASYTSSRYNLRFPNIIALVIPAIIGASLMVWLPDDYRIGKLCGIWLTNTTGAAVTIIYAWVAANFAGHTKKVTMNAILLMSFSLGNIIGPLSFTGASAPAYIPAKITIIASLSVCILATLCLAAAYHRENGKRDAEAAAAAQGGELVVDTEFMDLTDRQNRAFRYFL